MIAFRLTTSVEGEYESVELALIWYILARLGTDGYEEDFLILEPTLPIDGSLYLQSTLISTPAEAKRYIVETRIIQSDGSFRHYQGQSEQLSQVQAVFADYYLRNQAPDVTAWNDITDSFA